MGVVASDYRGSPRFTEKNSGIGLQARVLVIVIGLSGALVVLLSAYFIQQNQESMEEAMRLNTAVMREDLRNKGVVLARNVALASERAIAVMDFLFLTEVINTTVESDAEIAYGIIMDKERRALVHSDPERVGKQLDKAADRFAAAQEQVTSQERRLGETEILEVVSPMHVAEARWGTIRFGLSLANLNREIASSEERAKSAMKSSLWVALVIALLSILAATILGTLAARSILGPLGTLTQGVGRIREGKLDHTVEVEGAPELVNLAMAFNDMTSSLRERDAALRQNMAELEAALNKAEEANRLKSEFLANISHELRTPLNTIVNVPTALLKQYETFDLWRCENCRANFTAENGEKLPPGTAPRCPDCDSPVERESRIVCTGEVEEHRHFLRRLQQSGRHLLNVVNDLLDFSKMEAGRMELHPTEVNIVKVLKDLEDTVGPLATGKEIDLAFSTPAGSVTMDADEVKLTQIFINLVGNAIRFTGERGRIEVGAQPTGEEDGEFIRFWVTDNGVGIPNDQLEVIFEGFRQVDGSHTRQHGGTGLGLAITKRLVEMHHGRIWADSTMGEGSTFTFVLPRRFDAKRSNDEPSEPASSRARVLVVDDDQVQLEITRLVVEREGYAADLASSAGEAKKRIQQRAPQAIILDIMMPEVSGIVLLKEVKADPATRDIPILIATAYHSNREVVEQYGGIWMPKPWDASELARSLHTLLK